jgi:hypothetical protein
MIVVTAVVLLKEEGKNLRLIGERTKLWHRCALNDCRRKQFKQHVPPIIPISSIRHTIVCPPKPLIDHGPKSPFKELDDLFQYFKASSFRTKSCKWSL